LVWTQLEEGAELCWCEHSWERAQSYVGVNIAVWSLKAECHCSYMPPAYRTKNLHSVQRETEVFPVICTAAAVSSTCWLYQSLGLEVSYVINFWFEGVMWSSSVLVVRGVRKRSHECVCVCVCCCCNCLPCRVVFSCSMQYNGICQRALILTSLPSATNSAEETLRL